MFRASASLAASRPVVLFGYESSAFTWKARLALKLKQIPYTFITVPSMMPRPVLKDTFGLTYRKIPVMAIGRDVYCDTSLICEALEHFYPDKERTLYPRTADGVNLRPMMRGFASYWIDRPYFRATCGMMPADIWRTSFGTDRAALIGHKLDPDYLERKIPENTWKLDQHLSMLEPLFEGRDRLQQPWIFGTPTPSLGDIALWYQTWWCTEISAGRLMENLTGGGIPDSPHPGAGAVFNADRYPGIWDWYHSFSRYFDALPNVEATDPDWQDVLKQLKGTPELARSAWLLPTPRPAQAEIDSKCGLTEGSLVSIAPDDTGKADPTIGTLVASSPEEFVITPQRLEKDPEVDVRVHFPRLAFVARPAKSSKI
ncbi:hypothetical protein HII31_09323 [Pseudocercospora fuligena]|uniref:GST N-terminal domain-containing protein n=1 Tax=Pseudocercospora fuligena TaxID=685502 RepID=A0A8H6RCJ0_9PEZI|nr:hypothetical protein HII31_09323 [Pseudocercospora fuligena]